MGEIFRITTATCHGDTEPHSGAGFRAPRTGLEAEDD